MRNPHEPISRALAVRAYPVVEARRAVWIWMGAAEKANPAAVRDLAFLGRAPDTAFNKGYIRGTGHYQLFVDNILDLSHIDHLHPAVVGHGQKLFETLNRSLTQASIRLAAPSLAQVNRIGRPPPGRFAPADMGA